MTKASEAIRKELARLAGKSKTRDTSFSREAPCDWRPLQVKDPRNCLPFTDAGAWEFIVEQIEAGTEVEAIVLEKPPGKSGYVMKLPGARGEPRIYIKLQIGSGFVLGRSFHYSER